MLIIKEPITLNSMNSIQTISGVFDEKIRGNYMLMASGFQPKELLHLLSSPPQVYLQENPMNSLLLENNINQNQEIKLNLVNQLINRLLISDTDSFTYQDNVFVSTVLEKLGITDVRQFYRNIQEQKQVNQKVNQLIGLYWNHLQELKEITDILELRLPKSKEAGNEEAKETKADNRYYLQNEIYQRLGTGIIYNQISSFQNNLPYAMDVINHNELLVSEQNRISDHILLTALKSNAITDLKMEICRHVNAYEYRMDLDDAKTQPDLLSDITGAVLMNLLDNIHYCRISQFLEKPKLWLKTEKALYLTSQNALQRYEFYHTQEEQYHTNNSSYTSGLNHILGDEVTNIGQLMKLYEENRKALYQEENYVPVQNLVQRLEYNHEETELNYKQYHIEQTGQELKFYENNNLIQNDKKEKKESGNRRKKKKINSDSNQNSDIENTQSASEIILQSMNRMLRMVKAASHIENSLIYQTLNSNLYNQNSGQPDQIDLITKESQFTQALQLQNSLQNTEQTLNNLTQINQQELLQHPVTVENMEQIEHNTPIGQEGTPDTQINLMTKDIQYIQALQLQNSLQNTEQSLNNLTQINQQELLQHPVTVENTEQIEHKTPIGQEGIQGTQNISNQVNNTELHQNKLELDMQSTSSYAKQLLESSLQQSNTWLEQNADIPAQQTSIEVNKEFLKNNSILQKNEYEYENKEQLVQQSAELRSYLESLNRQENNYTEQNTDIYLKKALEENHTELIQHAHLQENIYEDGNTEQSLQQNAYIKSRLDQINQKNIEMNQKVNSLQSDTKNITNITINKEKLRKDALRALENPQEVMKELLEAPVPVELKKDTVREQLFQQMDEVTRTIYESVLQYEKDPAGTLQSGIISKGSQGEMISDINQVMLTHTQEDRTATEEIHKTVAELHRQKELERFSEEPVNVLQSVTSLTKIPSMKLVHKRVQEEVTEEVLEEMLGHRNTKIQSSSVATENIVKQESITKTQISEMKNEIVAKSTQELTELIERGLQQQLGTISDRVITKLEKKLQNERARRGN